jgi:DNA-binding NtrC family response regulator
MKVLLVDDHPEVRLSLAGFIESLGHSATHAGSGSEALAAARLQRPDLVISDLRMPGMSGIDLLQALEELDDPPPFALMTAFGDAETAIQALRLGAMDYLRKPIDVRELHRVIEHVQQEQSAPHQPTPPLGQPSAEQADGLVVGGPAMARVVAFADRLHAAPDLPCLIEAETGCGKELLSRRIHHGGRPSATPFVALNCAAIAPGLFEAELFGYAAGAFTGALAGGNQGKLTLAAGGTLLLDEIADLPLDQQAKLLRVLEERSWYPVGSNQLQRLKARVVCACNSDLLERVRTGRFREDLYYRLKVGHLRIPPLRERRDEILPLARSLLMRIRKTRGKGPQRFSSEAERLLESQPWPGNVRQLRHLLEQACLLADGAVLDAPALAELLPSAAPATAPAAASASALPRPPAILALPDGGFDLDAWTRAVVAAALARNDGSPVRTATYLGVTRKVLYTLRKRYGLLNGAEPA